VLRKLRRRGRETPNWRGALNEGNIIIERKKRVKHKEFTGEARCGLASKLQHGKKK
jgi:hypothetical protein